MKPTVEILNSLFGPDLDNMQRAMTRTTRRHALLVDNLANINTPNYKRKDLDFGITLDEELSSHPSRLPRSDAGDRLSSDDDDTSVRMDGNSVDLEREVMAISETELHYQALADMASNYLANLKTVIKEGK